VIHPDRTSAWAQYTIRVSNREQWQAALQDAGIPTAVHYPVPLNRQPAINDSIASLPVSDHAADTVMSLPMHPYWTEESLTETVDAISQCIKR